MLAGKTRKPDDTIWTSPILDIPKVIQEALKELGKLGFQYAYVVAFTREGERCNICGREK